jgi:hypothetical protein
MFVLNTTFVIIFFAVCTSFASTQETLLERMVSRTAEHPYLNLTKVIELYLQPHFHVNQNGETAFNCDSLFQKVVDQHNQDAGGTWPPPEQVPEELVTEFTLHGMIPQSFWYWAESNLSTNSVKLWSDNEYNKFVGKESSCGGYQTPVCEEVFSKFRDILKGKRVLVLGSQSPWAEARLLDYDVQDILTVEYVSIENSHPKVTVLKPHELATLYLSRSLPPIDIIFTFSSIEHDGLGRYGDPINPFGDLETMARMHCLLPPEGYLFLGIPTGSIDVLVWNAHRIYGRHRMRLLLQSWWEIIDFYHSLDIEFLSNEVTAGDNDTAGEYEEALWVLRKPARFESTKVNDVANIHEEDLGLTEL